MTVERFFAVLSSAGPTAGLVFAVDGDLVRALPRA
jgi:hypothetical protein